MTNFIGKRSVALGLAGALALAAIVPASAAPVSGGASLASALPGHTTEQVQWRGRGRGWGWAGAGVAAGLAIGAIAASRPYYGYGPNYYYGPDYAPAYAYPAPVYVEPAPVYVAPPAQVYAAPQPNPNYGPRQCWVVRNADQNLGYWAPC